MQIMFQQLRPGNSYARISWQDLFAAMKVYCERYSHGPEQQQVGLQHLPPAHSKQSPSLTSVYTCAGMYQVYHVLMNQAVHMMTPFPRPP